jgi:hypothetical protein
MQAGLIRKRLTLRDIFSLRMAFLVAQDVLFVLFDSTPSACLATRGMLLAA